MKKLLDIQSELKAPKNQFNGFGKYKYRSCEDIVEAVKPLTFKYNCILLLSDELVSIGDRYYIKSTATIKDLDSDKYETVYGYAREEESKKGMDGSQITGSSSSYARKYALNGLFLIDDTKDSDSTNTNGKEKQTTDLEKKEIFDLVRFEKLKKWSDGKGKEEVMQYILKIKKDYEIEEEVKSNLDLFVNSFEG